MTHIALVNNVDGENITLEDALSLSTASSNTTPASFSTNVNRGGIAIRPGSLPSNPTPGTLAMDSNDNNTLKWWSGSVWVTAGS
jgi:hypothetical protein